MIFRIIRWPIKAFIISRWICRADQQHTPSSSCCIFTYGTLSKNTANLTLNEGWFDGLWCLQEMGRREFLRRNARRQPISTHEKKKLNAKQCNIHVTFKFKMTFSCLFYTKNAPFAMWNVNCITYSILKCVHWCTSHWFRSSIDSAGRATARSGDSKHSSLSQLKYVSERPSARCSNFSIAATLSWNFTLEYMHKCAKPNFIKIGGVVKKLESGAYNSSTLQRGRETKKLFTNYFFAWDYVESMQLPKTVLMTIGAALGLRPASPI